MCIRSSLVIFSFLLVVPVYSQYWGERVAEKSFEHADFFFQPSFLNPYGIGGIGSAVVGLIDDPLLNLHINPALLSATPLPPHHIYINFRSDVTVRDCNEYYVHPLYNYSLDYAQDSYAMGYPHYYATATRKTAEPVVAAAYLLRPFSGRSNYTLGVTYQAVFQDERYYEIPQNIYRSQLGADYSGRAVADENNIPVIDRYRGEDEMHQQGHFLSLVNSLAILPDLDIGWRLSRVIYNRDGSFGTAELWDNSTHYYYSSARTFRKNRSQEYAHWDALAGVTLQANRRLKIGMALGLLDGEVTQDLTEFDLSDYSYGNRDKDKSWGIYDRRFEQDQFWRHQGRTTYATASIQSRLNPTISLCAYYRLSMEDMALRLSSVLADTSFSEYRNEWRDSHNDRDYIFYSKSNFKIADSRQGDGDQTGRVQQGATFIQWQVDDQTKLDVGVQWSDKHREITNCETVFAQRSNHYQWQSNDQKESYDEIAAESKDLRWRITSHTFTLQIPLFLQRQVSPTFALLFGINRKMTQWRMDDVTEAWFRYQEETVNGQTMTRGPVIERYTSPKEVRTDIETVLLGGVLISPAKKFTIRLMAVPTYIKTFNGTELDELQWWIDFNLFP